MKQSRLASLVEQIGNTATGFLIALAVQTFIFPLIFGVPSTFHQDIAIVGVFTVASIVRGYLWRRAMEALQVRRPLTAFEHAVIAECWRHRDQEGFSAEHDDQLAHGELACAGATYLYAASKTGRPVRERLRDADHYSVIRHLWPWSWGWWKPDVDDIRHDLIRGCALGIQEGNRFERQRRRPGHDERRSS